MNIVPLSTPTSTDPDGPGADPRETRLATLLDRAARLGPEYAPGLSSHLPMALAALSALGADDTRLQTFHERASQAFGPPRPRVPPRAIGEAWLALRGHVEAFDTLEAHFTAVLAQEGSERTLRAALPALMDGVAAVAFHGLIRTAYAVETGRSAELAAALAYWACRWLPLPRPDRGDLLDIDGWCARLLAMPPGPRPAGALITDRVMAIVGNAAYAALVGRLQRVGPGDPVGARRQLARLAGFAIERYLCSRNFTVLHMVTGAHALRRLWPWLDEPATAVTRFADAFAAAYLVTGLAPDAAPLRSSGLDWPEIIQRARASDDDHVIKFVHSCRCEAVVHGDAPYRHAAGLAVS